MINTDKNNKNRRKSIRETTIGWFFCSPFVLFSLVLFLIPLIWAVWLATMDWNLMSSNKVFVGVDNFLNVFSDKNAIEAFKNSLIYFGTVVTLSVSSGVIIALLAHQVPKKFRGIVSVLFFIPFLTSGVATSVIVKYMFAYNSIFNEMLRNNFGLNINWFAEKIPAFLMIVATVVWKLSGYYALFILAAINSITDDIKEAASLDGSTGMHKFFHITLPMILPTLTTVIILATGTSLSIYTEPFLLTEGGPLNATTTWTLEIYKTAFTKFESGYGSAMAITFAIQIFLMLKVINVSLDKVNSKFGV